MLLCTYTCCSSILLLDANSMLSSHLFTSCSCHIFICFPHTLFASCTVIIICSLFAFIYIFSSFMHLLSSYLALASVVLFCPYSAHCSFSFVSLFTFISPYELISYFVHLRSTNYSFAHLPTCHFLLPFLPCYFPGFSFHQIPILFTISMFNFATLLPYTLPPPFFPSFIVTISSFFYSSFNFISDFFPLFSPPSFPFSFVLHIWRHIRLALFCNIVVNILRFLYLAVSHNITSHLRCQICLHFFSFLGMCW